MASVTKTLGTGFLIRFGESYRGSDGWSTRENGRGRRKDGEKRETRGRRGFTNNVNGRGSTRTYGDTG